MASPSRARRSVLVCGLALAALAAWLVLAGPRAERERVTAQGAAASGSPAEGSPAALEKESLPAPVAGLRHALQDAPEPLAVLVTVVDAADRPAGGIELELLARLDSGEEVPLARSSSRTGDGQARLVPGARPAAGAWLRVVCRASFFPPPALELGSELPADPLVLRLPGHGSVEVRLQRDGAPIGHPAQVELLLPEHPEVPARIVTAQDGRARFEAVGTGLELELRARSEESGPSEPVRAAGPRTPGEVVTVPLALGPLWPRVRLRVLDAAGAPLVREDFGGWVDYGTHATPLTASPRSDAEGWLEFHLPGAPAEQGERSLVLHPGRSDDDRRARVAIPDPLDPARVTALGTATIGRTSDATAKDQGRQLSRP